MDWNQLLKGALAAAIGGAISGASSVATTDGNMDLKKVGMAAGVGAALTLFSYLKQPPAKKQ